jgi:hypothetical protein
MNFLIKNKMETNVEKVWVDDTAVYIQTDTGAVFSEKFADYRRLRNATAKQRAAFICNNTGIRWDELDEDLSFEGFMHKKDKQNELYRLFKKYDELNVSAIARSLNIPQSLMASYLCGIKKPSDKRLEQIKNKLHSLGNELAAIEF